MASLRARPLLALGLCLLLYAVALNAFTSGGAAHVARFAMPSLLWATDNPSIGYNVLWHGDFLNIENLFAFTQVEALQGIKRHHAGGWTDQRIFYAFTSLVFQPLLGDILAFRLTNIVLFTGSAVLIFLIARDISGRKEGGLAGALLFAVSMPAAATMGSYSAHIGSMFFACLWLWLMLRVLGQPGSLRPRSVLGLSGVLGLWALTYGSWVVGLGTLVVILMVQRRWLLIPIPVLIGFAAGKAQIFAMEWAGFGSVPDGQIAVLKLAWTTHWAGISALDTAYVWSIAKFFFDLLFIDNPAIIILGLVALFCYRGRAVLLFWAMAALPVGLLFIYQPPDSYIRGYAVPGLAAVIYPLIGYWFARAFEAMRERRAARIALMSLVVVLAGTSLVWANLFRAGVTLPTVAYFSGASNLCHPLTLAPTSYLDATGSPGVTPRIFGGTAPLSDFVEMRPGATPPDASQVTGPVSWAKSWLVAKPMALKVQSVILLLIACALFGLLRARIAMLALVAILIAVFVPMRHRVADYTAMFSAWNYKALKTNDRIDASMQLTTAFVERLKASAAPDATAQIYINHIGRGGLCMRMSALGKTETSQPPWPWGDPRAATTVSMPLGVMIERLAAAGNRLDVSFGPQGEACQKDVVTVGGWRRTGPAHGRSARMTTADAGTTELDRFPTIEIRVERTGSSSPVGFGPYTELRRRLACVATIGY
jgi:hypothetical protein